MNRYILSTSRSSSVAPERGRSTPSIERRRDWTVSNCFGELWFLSGWGVRPVAVHNNYPSPTDGSIPGHGAPLTRRSGCKDTRLAAVDSLKPWSFSQATFWNTRTLSR